MPLSLFALTLSRISKYSNIRYVTLHFYNEPTIDPLFFERVEMLSRRGLKLILFTNGSGLNPSYLEKLKASHVINRIYFTIPSIEEREFKQYVGDTADLVHSVDIIRLAVKLGFDVRLSIQGLSEDRQRRRKEVCQYFDLPLTQAAEWETYDRAGSVPRQNSGQHTCIESRCLVGCPHILTRLYISVDGDILLCDQDFFKNNCLGNIQTGQLQDILSGQTARKYKRWIFGMEYAPNDWICRRCQRMAQSQNMERFRKGKLDL